MTFDRAVLGLVGVLFIPFGLWGLVNPVAVTAMTQVGLPTPTALADGRAVYGGLTLGLAVYFVVCALRPELVRAGLWALLLTIGGAFLGRLTGVALDGAGNPDTLSTLGLELAIAALAAVALRRAPRQAV